MANVQILVLCMTAMTCFEAPIQYPNKKFHSNTMLFIIYDAFIPNTFNCFQGIHNLTYDLAFPNTMFYYLRYWIGFSTIFFMTSNMVILCSLMYCGSTEACFGMLEYHENISIIQNHDVQYIIVSYIIVP